MLYLFQDHTTFFQIAAILLGLLSIAHLINLSLLLSLPGKEVFEKVNIIIKSWWGIAIVVLGAAFFGPNGFLLLFTALAVLTIKEYFRRTKITSYKGRIQCLFFIGILIQAALIYTKSIAVFSVFPSLFSLIAVPFVVFQKESREDLTRYLSVYFGVLFFTHFILYSYAIVSMGPTLLGSYEDTLIFYFLVLGLTQFNDVLQFLFGKTLGRRKIVPHLSPNKTEAGFIGGLASTSLISSYLFSELLGIPVPTAALIGLCISFFGICGDLTFSTIKRFIGVKDFSDAIPGHGGYLDRLDSVIFTGPILFYIIYFSRQGF